MGRNKKRQAEGDGQAAVAAAAESSEDAKARRMLFVRNLAYSATTDDLRAAFQDIGPIKTCYVVTDPNTKKCRGFG